MENINYCGDCKYFDRNRCTNVNNARIEGDQIYLGSFIDGGVLDHVYLNHTSIISDCQYYEDGDSNFPFGL